MYKQVSIKPSFTYSKEEKLKSRKLIGQLFSSGSSASAFPLKILYHVSDDFAVPLQAGVAVSSRNFKTAVDRNRVKRVLREAYRLQKCNLEEQLKQQSKRLVLFIIYTGKELPQYDDVMQKMETVLEKIRLVISKEMQSK